MKYNLIGLNDYKVNPIETILNNRGVEDIEAFMNVSVKNTHDYRLLENIDKAVDKIIEHIEKGSKILINTDSDVDGMTSSAIIYNYLDRIKKNATLDFHVHNVKIHGVFSKDVADDVGLVISPDSASFDFEEHENLFDRGIDIVIPDHHSPSSGEGYSKHAIVVNNQLCDYPNKEFSGAGIVYKLCQALDDKLGLNHADDFLDLLAIGLVADLMSLQSLETRYYVLEGIKEENLKNPFMIELFEKQHYSTKGIISVKTLGWNIAPLINATIRFGSLEEKRNMFKAMLESCGDTLPYKKRGSDVVIDQPIAQAMARICGNVKGRQDRARDKSVKELEIQIEEEELGQENILMVNATDVLNKSLTGLVAMQLAQKYKRPTLILHERVNKVKNEDGEEFEELVYHGSGRNFNNSPIKDFNGLLADLSLFNYVSGHPNAFGHEVTQERLCEVKDKTDILLKDIEFNENYDVDFAIPAHELKYQFVKTITDAENCFGKEVERPLMIIEDIVLNTTNIKLRGKYKNTITFVSNGVEFVKPWANEETYLDLIGDDTTIKLSVIGECAVNHWAGKAISQIEIKDWSKSEVTEVEDIMIHF